MFAAVSFLLMLFGLFVSVGFWVPRFCDRARLKDLLGTRYPLVYLVYVANGPLVFGLGLFLYRRFG